VEKELKKYLDKGMKFDGDKLRMDLVPIPAIKAMAMGFGYGAKKYGEWNWRYFKKEDWKRLYAACLRHLFAWWEGEEIDEESELHHLVLATCEIAMLTSLVVFDYGLEGE